MGKKMKRGLMRPPYYPVDEEAKNRLKLQGLMQDFAELQKVRFLSSVLFLFFVGYEDCRVC